MTKRSLLVTFCCFLLAANSFAQTLSQHSQRNKGKHLVIELTIAGFPAIPKFELALDEGASFGCGGGTTPAAKLEGYRCGMSLVTLSRNDATVSFEVTLRYVDGTERKVADRFVVRKAKRESYKFAEGLGIEAYSSRKRSPAHSQP